MLMTRLSIQKVMQGRQRAYLFILISITTDPIRGIREPLSHWPSRFVLTGTRKSKLNLTLEGTIIFQGKSMGVVYVGFRPADYNFWCIQCHGHWI